MIFDQHCIELRYSVVDFFFAKHDSPTATDVIELYIRSHS